MTVGNSNEKWDSLKLSSRAFAANINRHFYYFYITQIKHQLIKFALLVFARKITLRSLQTKPHSRLVPRKTFCVLWLYFHNSQTEANIVITNQTSNVFQLMYFEEKFYLLDKYKYNSKLLISTCK